MSSGGTKTIERETASPEGTAEVAAELAGRLRAGDAVIVTGRMGAGKTTFVRGACRALGVTAPVTSPTFTIGRLYATEGASPPGVEAVGHLDLYRLGSLDDEEPGILDDYVNPATVAFLEWPEVALAEIESLRFAVSIELVPGAGDSRRITIEELG